MWAVLWRPGSYKNTFSLISRGNFKLQKLWLQAWRRKRGWTTGENYPSLFTHRFVMIINGLPEVRAGEQHWIYTPHNPHCMWFCCAISCYFNKKKPDPSSCSHKGHLRSTYCTYGSIPRFRYLTHMNRTNNTVTSVTQKCLDQIFFCSGQICCCYNVLCPTWGVSVGCHGLAMVLSSLNTN